MTTTINGVEYALATTLRVAYTVQGMNNHKPYTEVFQGIGSMPVESQIDILFAAFKVANPDAAAQLPLKDFRDYYLDNFNLGDLMKQLEGVIQGIMGTEDAEKPAETPDTDSATTPEGN